MMFPVFVGDHKKLCQRSAIFSPFFWSHPRDNCEPFIVIWQSLPALPIIHQQEHVRAVLRRLEVQGINEVFGDV